VAADELSSARACAPNPAARGEQQDNPNAVDSRIRFEARPDASSE